MKSTINLLESIKGELKEDSREVPDVYTELKSAFPNDTVDLYMDSIQVSFYSNESTQLYGSIFFKDKVAKLAMASGPNPLEPSFLEILNKVSNILKGYTMEHY